MKSWLLGGMLAAAISLPALSGVAQAQVPNVGCSNATLKGPYAFAIQGELVGILASGTLHPFDPPIPLNALAMANFDGMGHFTQVDFAMQDGKVRGGSPIPPAFEGDESGPYTVNPDCTGNFEIDSPTGSKIKVVFVLANEGSQMHIVVYSVHAPGSPPPPTAQHVVPAAATLASRCEAMDPNCCRRTASKGRNARKAGHHARSFCSYARLPNACEAGRFEAEPAVPLAKTKRPVSALKAVLRR
jgi:hypothetical protein